MSSGYERPYTQKEIGWLAQPRPQAPENVVVHNPFQMQLDAQPEITRPAKGNNIRDLINRLRQRPTQVAPAPKAPDAPEPKSVLQK